MNNRKLIGILLILVIPFLIVACGTIATPEPDKNQPDILEEAHEDTSEDVTESKATEIPSTEIPPTEIPPTQTATEKPPTEIPPTEVPPTEAPATEEPVGVGFSGDPVLGKVLFEEFQPAASFACMTCHLVDAEAMLIGPGLLNVGKRAEMRVEGMSAYDYLHASIVSPNDYVVDGYTPDLMPQNFSEIFSEEDINNLIAYLNTLGEGTDTLSQEKSNDETATADEVSSTSTEDSNAVESSDLETLILETGDAVNGQALFNEFQASVSFACATCHLVDTEAMLIGPGLLNVSVRSKTRIDGISAAQYLYTSIVSPDDYVVETYPAMLMPQTFSEIFSEQEIYDIVAYLYTLK